MNNNKRLSKFMSLVLRHKPELIGLVPDENGWVPVRQLIEGMSAKGFIINEQILDEVVTTNDKQRFSFNDEKSLIRANQGHSISVDLDLANLTPPDILYHGTAAHVVPSILQQGLLRGSRHHVHLSETIITAKTVGSRHGVPVVLSINAKAMHDAGFKFHQSENKVWLTETVPPEYISQ